MEDVIHATYFHFLTTGISISLPLIWNISILFIKKLSMQFLSNDSLEDWSSNFEGHNAELVVCHIYNSMQGGRVEFCIFIAILDCLVIQIWSARALCNYSNLNIIGILGCDTVSSGKWVPTFCVPYYLHLQVMCVLTVGKHKTLHKKWYLICSS